jgi:hypothetical protein
LFAKSVKLYCSMTSFGKSDKCIRTYSNVLTECIDKFFYVDRAESGSFS